MCRSTLPPRALRYVAGWLSSGTPKDETEFLESLSDETLRALPWIFEFWALPHQIPPEGAWRTWMIIGGRGAGKTRAGAEWVRSIVEGAGPEEPGKAKRIALIGETQDQAREVMVFGESGILACTPPDRRPEWKASRKRLEWPNGASAQVYSAHDPESLRGPQFDAAWADELAKWPRAEETWDMLQFALRLGSAPRACVTTTPRNVSVLKRLMHSPSTVMTHGGTEANRANLAPSFLEEVQARYGGTRLGRQELDGEFLDEAEGALWSLATLERAATRQAPELDRVVVAVDPPATGKRASDMCGIVVAGVRMDGPPKDWVAWVIEDVSVAGASPSAWAHAAVAAMDRHQADRLVAEVNQGGDMVKQVLDQFDPTLPYRAVHATRSKVQRAEPVAALYEQGRIRHLPGLQALEEQMCQMTLSGFKGGGSPDRLDALVWAITELMIHPVRRLRNPGIRSLA
ncbi:MAG: terminase family protein [Pseudomonadota bacterium]